MTRETERELGLAVLPLRPSPCVAALCVPVAALPGADGAACVQLYLAAGPLHGWPEGCDGQHSGRTGAEGGQGDVAAANNTQGLRRSRIQFSARVCAAARHLPAAGPFCGSRVLSLSNNNDAARTAVGSRL